MVKEFELDGCTTYTDAPAAIYAIYDTPPYEGYALVIYREDNGQFGVVEASHCSCYGLEGQWQPTTMPYEALEKVATEARYGLFRDRRDEILAWLREAAMGVR